MPNVLALVFLFAPAVAAPPDMGGDAWAAELVPAIEAEVGRRFVDVPPVKFGTVEQIRAREDQIRAQARELGLYVLDGVHGTHTEGVLGEYLLATREVWVPREDRPAGVITPERLADARCTAAHGLVHALHHQYLASPTGPEHEVTLALREGHAHAIARRVCGEEPAARVDVALGIDALTTLSPTHRVAFPHGYAARFVDALDQVAGREAVWAVLADVAPARALVERVGAVGLVPGWADAAVLGPALATLPDMAGRTVESGPSTAARGLLPLVETGARRVEGDEAPFVPTAAAGMTWRATFGGHEASARAFLLTDDAAARAWVTRRIAALNGGRFRTFYGAAYEPARVTRTPDGLAVSIARGGDWAYLERWAVRGRRLYGIAVEDARPRVADVTRALEALVALDLPEVAVDAVSADDVAALRAFAPTEPVPAVLTSEYHWARLYPALLRKDWAACVIGVDAALAVLPSADGGLLATAGYDCASRASDLDGVLRFYRLVPRPELFPDVWVVRAAEAFLAAGRPQDALDMLAPPQGPRLAPSITSLRLAANVDLRRWDEVERLVWAPEVLPSYRRDAARALAKVGRNAVATRVMWAACAGFEGEERAACEREAGGM